MKDYSVYHRKYVFLFYKMKKNNCKWDKKNSDIIKLIWIMVFIKGIALETVGKKKKIYN